jgi:hypothetical protein
MGRLSSTTIERAATRNPDLASIMLDGSSVGECRPVGAEPHDCVMLDVELERSDIRGVNLKGANINRVSFRSAEQRSANLGRNNPGGSALPSGSDFTNAGLVAPGGLAALVWGIIARKPFAPSNRSWRIDKDVKPVAKSFNNQGQGPFALPVSHRSHGVYFDDVALARDPTGRPLCQDPANLVLSLILPSLPRRG